jgi:hypothetical protein
MLQVAQHREIILFEVQLRLKGRSRFVTYDPEGRPVDWRLVAASAA